MGHILKTNTIILACAAFLATAAPSFADAPILLREPLPQGFVYPRSLPLPTMPPAAPGKIINLLCFSYDVGTDGFVHNMRLLRSTGDSELDKDAMTWWQQKHYEPATLNGVSVAVRELGGYAIGNGAHFSEYVNADSPDACSWALYDSQTDGTAVQPTH